MAIIEAELIHRLSGGGTNIIPDNALGGAMSTVSGGIIATNTDNNDMDDINSDEAFAGITIYRGYYYENINSLLDWTDPVFWIESAASTAAVSIAIADEPVNSPMATIPNEETAPTGSVTFSAPANKGFGIPITTLGPDDNRGHWIEYVLPPLSSAASDPYTIKAEGDTLP